jgi:hypothetical protein
MAPVSINQSPILTPNTMTTVQDNQQPQAVANIVVIGAGWWSQGWHLPQLKRNQHARILAIVDSSPHPQSNLNPNLEPLTVLSEKYNCRIFSSVQELLNDTDLAPNIDGCIVCTPHATHFQVGKLLIDENNKRERPIHILMEKPMTTNVDEAKEMHEVRNLMTIASYRRCLLPGCCPRAMAQMHLVCPVISLSLSLIHTARSRIQVVWRKRLFSGQPFCQLSHTMPKSTRDYKIHWRHSFRYGQHGLALELDL